jgi:hypothetical protein
VRKKKKKKSQKQKKKKKKKKKNQLTPKVFKHKNQTEKPDPPRTATASFPTKPNDERDAAMPVALQGGRSAARRAA